MGIPGRLEHLPPWVAASVRAAEAEAVRRQMAANWNQVFDAKKQAHQLDKELPRDLNWLMSVIQNKDAPIEHRAKALEVVILRGVDEKVTYQEMERWSQPPLSAYSPKMEYQLAAMTAIISGSPAVFDQLSKSADQLPTGRAPATEWMNTMLREGGMAGNFERRQSVEAWLIQLPPETRGRAMYHLRDAADAKEIGEVTKVTGFEVGVGPVSGGLQWQPGPDTHWKQVGDDLRLGVTRDLDQKPEERVAFYTGYMKADPGLEDPKEAANGRK